MSRTLQGMVRLTVLLLLFAGCSASTEPARDGSVPVDASAADAGRDAGRDSGTSSPNDAGADAGSSCECTEVSACCDGCRPRNYLAPCDDGLACVAGTTCAWDGTCGGGSPACGSPTWPACRSVTCSEPAGCAYANVNEGGPCDDGRSATFDDRCSAGTCVGTPCECSSGSCCDGCHLEPYGTPCSFVVSETICAGAGGSIRKNYLGFACDVDGTCDQLGPSGEYSYSGCSGTCPAGQTCLGACITSGVDRCVVEAPGCLSGTTLLYETGVCP